MDNLSSSLYALCSYGEKSGAIPAIYAVNNLLQREARTDRVSGQLPLAIDAFASKIERYIYIYISGTRSRSGLHCMYVYMCAAAIAAATATAC